MKRYAHLGSYLIVEGILRERGELVTKAELKEKVSDNELDIILIYLERKGKIFSSQKGTLWVHTPRKELDKSLLAGTEL